MNTYCNLKSIDVPAISADSFRALLETLKGGKVEMPAEGYFRLNSADSTRYGLAPMAEGETVYTFTPAAKNSKSGKYQTDLPEVTIVPAARWYHGFTSARVLKTMAEALNLKNEWLQLETLAKRDFPRFSEAYSRAEKAENASAKKTAYADCVAACKPVFAQLREMCDISRDECGESGDYFFGKRSIDKRVARVIASETVKRDANGLVKYATRDSFILASIKIMACFLTDTSISALQTAKISKSESEAAGLKAYTKAVATSGYCIPKAVYGYLDTAEKETAEAKRAEVMAFRAKMAEKREGEVA